MRSLTGGPRRGGDRPGAAPQYPPALEADVADDYHGTLVRDPYRWLEDPDSPETQRWVAAQNRLTRAFVDGPARDALVEELTGLYDYPRTSIPVKRGGRYFFTHNPGLQNQPLLYVQDGLDAAARVLIDPNALSADGTAALTAVAVNDAGTDVAYAISRSGSDRQDLFVRDAASGADRPDHLRWLKFAAIAWTPEGDGFYYTRFPEPGTVPAGDEHYFPTVCFHRLGEPQARDALVFERPEERETVFSVSVSDDGRWVVLTAYRGSSDRSEVFVLDRRAPGGGPRPLFTGFRSAYSFAGVLADELLFVTDDGAPRGRVVAVDPGAPGTAREVVSETADKLTAALVAHDSLVTCHLHDASDLVSIWDPRSRDRRAGGIPLPGVGSIAGLSGRREDDELFLGFSSYTQAPVAIRYDFRGMGVSTFAPGLTGSADAPPGAASRRRVRSDDYVTRQVWFSSKDGTRVSMFLVHRRDLALDGGRPVLLNGYGGFNVNMTPAFDPAAFVLLDRGGVFAQAQLRGGGEYGEAWHEAGMFERKQNVFDDFIAAAEWLIASGVTVPGALAIEGGSNGGLLTAAVMLQRPDLFGAVLCRVPVADMLRYHRFTVGRFWVSEYGCADDPSQFPYLYAYSPCHNVRPGARYPPMLITTADTDDRVAPGMAKKLAARLQAAASGGPFLIRVETKAGHGAGKPVSKMIEEDADIFSFLFSCLEAS